MYSTVLYLCNLNYEDNSYAGLDNPKMMELTSVNSLF